MRLQQLSKASILSLVMAKCRNNGNYKSFLIFFMIKKSALPSVEKDSLSANKWDEIDGRKTDVKNTKPKKLSYAEITKKRKLSWKRDESSKNTPQSE
jgi:hypothetical protein